MTKLKSINDCEIMRKRLTFLLRFRMHPFRWFCACLAAAVLIGVCSQAQAAPISYYRFEEGLGNTVIDAVDNSVDGTHTAVYSSGVPVDPVPQTGASNQFSLEFNNSAGATITGQDFIFHSIFGNATLEFWLNVPEQAHSAIFWTRGDNDDKNRFNISVNPGGVIHMDYRDIAGALHIILPLDGSFTVPLDTWTHVAVTRVVDSPTSHTYGFFKDGFLTTTKTDINPNLPVATQWTISGRIGWERISC